MALVFEQVHAAPEPKKTNEEWFILANQGASPINTSGLAVIVGPPGKRGSWLGQIDPGFILQPGEKILVVSGIPGKKSQGEPPVKDGLRTYHLFQREPILRGNGSVLRLALNQIDMAKVTFDRSAPDGIARS
jgi:hypothetical protein